MIYRSTDSGQTWIIRLAPDTGPIIGCYSEDMAYDAQNPAWVYAAIPCSGLWRSTDSGQSWALQGQGSPYEWDLTLAKRIAVEPSAPYRVFVKTWDTNSGSTLYFSEDHGATWQQADDPPFKVPNQLSFAHGEPPVLYAALGGAYGPSGLFRTVNGGRSWSEADGELGQVPIYALAVVTATDRVILYAATSGGVIEAAGGQAVRASQQTSTFVPAGVYRYTALDNADLQPWEQVNVNGFGNASNMFISAVEPFAGQLYAGTQNNTGAAQVWRTIDGTSWTQFDPSWTVSNTKVSDMQTFGGHLYVGTYNPDGGEIWRTDGSTWQQVVTGGFGDANNSSMTTFAVLDALYLAVGHEVNGVAIWRSPSGEPGSWTPVITDGFGGPGLWGNSTLEVYDGHLYVGLAREAAELWRTADGLTWTP
ncbi:MAG: hypothetical protein JXM73_19250, partial [Anaerolineae bacterium]|nr:hypothetical protein [Anaerolineae bacterium]